MKWHIYKVSREPGFRLNMIDIIVVLLVFLLTLYARPIFLDNFLYLLPAYVALSFFLFCNVFRIGNKLEPFWYIPFMLLTLYGLTRPDIFWLLVLGVCEPLRIGLIIYHIRNRKYVGAFYGQLGKFQKR
jgi:hypothetical protein